MKLQAPNSSNFFGKKFFGGDGFQSMFVYQRTFNVLELKKHKSTEYVIGWKLKGLFESKFLSVHVLS